MPKLLMAAAAATGLLFSPAVAFGAVTVAFTFTSGHDELTPAVTGGGAFSDARDSALALAWPRISPAVSSDGVFSDARDTALSAVLHPAG